MDYSKMSDFEINWRVFESLHNGAPDFKEGENGAMVVTFTANDVQLGEHVEFEVEAGSFNPCNSWADAGPIIEKFGIGLMPFKKSPAKAWPLSVGLLSNAGVEHENPLCAAMIVYLMMHDKGEE